MLRVVLRDTTARGASYLLLSTLNPSPPVLGGRKSLPLLEICAWDPSPLILSQILRIAANTAEFSPATYPKQTRARHRKLILDFYGFMPFGWKARKDLIAEIATMARTYLKPRLIFDRCVDYLIQRRVQVPRSGVLLELIRSGLQACKVELVARMDAHLTDDTRAFLDELFTTSDDQNRYRLTLA